MPIYKNYSDGKSQIFVWKYDEKDVFHDALLIPIDESVKVENYHPKKKLEYLMIRQMLKNTLPNHTIQYKNIGQPYLFPKDYFISISHSFPYASLVISTKRVGIDLEKINEKIFRVKHKFINQNEENWVYNQTEELQFLTIIWAIKEALYKLHPSKYWSLKKHYSVEKFSLDDLSEISCSVFDDDFVDNYIAKVEKLDNYYFAFIEENHNINYKIPFDK